MSCRTAESGGRERKARARFDSSRRPIPFPKRISHEGCSCSNDGSSRAIGRHRVRYGFLRKPISLWSDSWRLVYVCDRARVIIDLPKAWRSSLTFRVISQAVKIPLRSRFESFPSRRVFFLCVSKHKFSRHSVLYIRRVSAAIKVARLFLSISRKNAMPEHRAAAPLRDKSCYE